MIFDCFTFFNELEILAIRLNEMSPVVDRFVLVEAKRTYQGQPKPLYYNDNKYLFKQYQKKLIHIVTDFPDNIPNYYPKKSAAWRREYFQRDQIALGLKSAKKNDLVIVADVDEIIFC